MIPNSIDPDQPPLTRDLAEDEPDLPDDAELEALTPLLPDLDTDPLDPVPAVAPGPEEARPPLLGGPVPDNSLEEIADTASQGGYLDADKT